MQMKFFSIIVVALNPGDKLKETLDSIKMQECVDYEIIIKDGGSKDGALEELETSGYFNDFPSVTIVREKDGSIYEGMNQAVAHVTGKYVEFLNCGDCFYDEKVLGNVAEFIAGTAQGEKKETIYIPAVFYGNQYNRIQGSVITSAPQINDFTCYRNVPCHQVCFYSVDLFKERAFKMEYTVRADYEHFLYCVYEKKARTYAMPYIICFYEGGGYSETKENRKKSAMQHREITKKYLGKKAFLYRMVMILSMAPVRTMIAENPVLAKPYNALKSMIYKKR